MSKETKEQLAYALAKDAHEGQLYGDKDYFKYHVLGVANQFRLRCQHDKRDVKNTRCIKCGFNYPRGYILNHTCGTYDHEAYIVALLNDAVKDGDVGFDVIMNLFGVSIYNAIWLISKPVHNDYDWYIDRLNKYENQLATKVKIADLKFNLSQPDTKPALVKQYTEALAVLEGE